MKHSPIRNRWAAGLVAIACCLAWIGPAMAHDIAAHRTIIIDTDMGLDDIVTLAMALQSPEVEIGGIVICEGVAGREHGVELAERMLVRFNRKDIPLYAPDTSHAEKPAPPFRAFAEGAAETVLSEKVPAFHRPFSPEAYEVPNRKVTILALGPLTNLAAAFEQKPEIKQNIARILVAGEPDPNGAWNMRFDPQALAAVQKSGLKMTCVIRGEGSAKPESLSKKPLALGQGTSVGEMFLRDFLADDAVRAHYTGQFGTFHDEQAFMYLVDPTIFTQQGEQAIFAPANPHLVSHLFTHCITTGRQYKHRVILADRPLPDNAFMEDVRARRDEIIRKNGRDEWFSQLLMNELHQHLGAYSIIGVKMGLRAAELLNAPQHGMRIVSHTPLHPPASCLNDGIIVSTGSTPGRALFSQEPREPGLPCVTFTCGERTITLTLKKEYREKIKAQIKSLLSNHTLEDAEYWEGVRAFGLEIWENWHRKDLFDVTEEPAAAERTAAERTAA